MYEVAGQMSIFDWMRSKTDDIPVEDMAEDYLIERMQESTGLKFIKKDFTAGSECRYEAKHKKITYECSLDRLVVEPYSRFIGVGYGSTTEGGGRICDSLQKAIDCMKGFIERFEAKGV